MSWPLFLSFRQLFPPRKFPVFASVSIFGVASGVAALLVVQTVMGSFRTEHQKRLRDAVGDIVIRHRGEAPLTGVSDLFKTLDATPGVIAAAPQAEGFVVVMPGDADIAKAFSMSNTAQLRGIDPAREAKVSPLSGYIRGTPLAELDDESVYIGKRLADRLMLYPGAKILLETPQRAAKTLSGEGRRHLPKELNIVGLIDSGFRDIDSGIVITSMRVARDLLLLENRSATAIRLKTGDPGMIPDIAANIAKILPDEAEATPWFLFRREFLDAIAMEKQMLFLLMFIITLVASFSIASTLFSHVVRRTREIGLLRALGSRGGDILRLYVSQGFIIGIAGYAAGCALTFAIMTFRNEIINLIGAGDTVLKQYRFDKVPLHYDRADFLVCAALTITLVTLAALAPAIWAARRRPSEAMRDA